MKEIARYIYISSFPFLLLPSSRDDHLEFHFSIRSPRVHNLHTAIISLTKPSIPYLSFILFQKKKKEKKKEKKFSKRNIGSRDKFPNNCGIRNSVGRSQMRTRCEKEDRQRLSSSVFVPRLVLAVGSRENAWTHAHNGERERKRDIPLSPPR